MGNKLYVGGLSYATTDKQLEDLFAAHGTVESARVITDKFTGRSKGFGFVEMGSGAEAQSAMQALNGTDSTKPGRKSGGQASAGTVEALVVVAADAIAGSIHLLTSLEQERNRSGCALFRFYVSKNFPTTSASARRGARALVSL